MDIKWTHFLNRAIVHFQHNAIFIDIKLINFEEALYLNVSLDLLPSAGHLSKHKEWCFYRLIYQLMYQSQTASNVAAVIIVYKNQNNLWNWG